MPTPIILPGARRIDRSKIDESLLHPINGRGKAAYFQAYGFTLPRWENCAMPCSTMRRPASRRRWWFQTMAAGTLFVALCAPGGRQPQSVVCAVWHADNGAEGVRLITAYPA